MEETVRLYFMHLEHYKSKMLGWQCGTERHKLNPILHKKNKNLHRETTRSLIFTCKCKWQELLPPNRLAIHI